MATTASTSAPLTRTALVGRSIGLIKQQIGAHTRQVDVTIERAHEASCDLAVADRFAFRRHTAAGARVAVVDTGDAYVVVTLSSNLPPARVACIQHGGGAGPVLRSVIGRHGILPV